MAKDPGNTSATLDASEWTYNFEKARIKGATDNNILDNAQKMSDQALPSNLEYLDDSYDSTTGTSGTAFRDKTTGEVIIAYTGTNVNSDSLNDAFKSDFIGIGNGSGGHYQPAYNFYEKIADKYGEENITLAGHSLGGNVAQRVALKYNVKNTVVYNSAPLYIEDGPMKILTVTHNPVLAVTSWLSSKDNIKDIKKDEKDFTGRVTRITTEYDPLNNAVDVIGSIYEGGEYILKNSGGHSISDIRNSKNQVDQVNSILNNPQIDAAEQQLYVSIKKTPSYVKSDMGAVKSKMESLQTNDNHGVSADAKGLTGSEKIYIDYQQAMTISGGLSTVASTALSLVESKEKTAISKAEEIMNNLQAPPFCTLTDTEVKAAYKEGGVEEKTIVGNVKEHCAKTKNTYTQLSESFTNLQSRIQTGVAEIAQTDSDLAGLING